jgi:anti-sigma B factor antagonist
VSGSFDVNSSRAPIDSVSAGLGGFHVEERGDLRIIDVGCDVDIASAPRFGEALRPRDEGDARSVIVDLSGCRYMDSTGLTLLIKHHRAAKNFVVVLPPDSALNRLFEITQLKDYFRLADSRAAAVAGVSST